MATVEVRPNKTCKHPAETTCDTCSWRVTWRLGGRAGRKQSCTFATSQLANAANALCRSRRHQVTDTEVYRAIYGVNDTDSDVPTLAAWATTCLKRRRENGEVTRDYLDRQHSIIRRRIIPRLGDLRLTSDQITEETITDWVGWLRSQPGPAGTLKPPTVREAHTVLHGLLQAAVPRYLATNPAAAKVNGGRRKSGLPKVEPYEPMFLEQQEIDLIVAACPPAIRDMVVVSLLTGLRLGELVALRVDAVRLTGRNRAVLVRRALKKGGTVGQPKSRRSRRSVGISAQVARILRPRVEGQPRHALVFLAPEGGMWNPSNLRQRYWQPAVGAAMRCPVHPPPLPPKPTRGPRPGWRPDEVSTCGCKQRLHRRPRWHDLRHTHVSLCVEDGWDAVRVSRRVGHESYKTTMDIYGHLWEGGDAQVDGLDRFVLLANDEEE